MSGKNTSGKNMSGKNTSGKNVSGKTAPNKDRGTGVLTLPGGGKPVKPHGGKGKPRGARPGQRRGDGGMRPLSRRRRQS